MEGMYGHGEIMCYVKGWGKKLLPVGVRHCRI